MENQQSHCEVAIQGMLLAAEEEAAIAPFRAKNKAAANAAREALQWKLVKPKKWKKHVAKQDEAEVAAVETSMVSLSVDCDDEKLSRAAFRATNIHIERKQLQAANNAMKMGKRAGEGVKPHRQARVAERTCLARGAVESQEDMPSIVCVDSSWSRSTLARKPAVAPMLTSSAFEGVNANFHDA